jgi:hypothetical protein
MTNTIKGSCWVVFLVFLFGPHASAQWTNVGTGIDYQQFTITMSDGKANRLFIARMAANNTNCIINGMIAKNQVSGAVETVPTQASRYEDAINYWGKSWGQRNDVIVAINGSFYDIGGTDIITGGQAYDGWYAKRFDYGAQTGFVWKFDRSFFIADCLKTVVNQQTVTLGGGSRNYEGINTTRGSDDLIVYTPQYNNNTLTDNSGIEVLVELSSPLLMLDSPSGVNGTVRQVLNGQGSTRIPFDHVVLSGEGTAATFLQTRAQVGNTVKITADVDHYNVTCNTAAPSLANTYGLTQGYFVFLRDGAIVPTSNSGMIIRNPRTFVAHNASYVFFCVCDGRSSISAGMTSDEMGAFCKNHLGATDGVNQDGGGSSTMLINGVIKNVPSDGSPRAVANGLMMVNLQPKQVSTVFTSGQTVTTSGSANFRLGPGTDYYAFTSLAQGVQGTVVSHQLNGVYAKGYYWWKCNFSGTTGWIAESLLIVPSTAPSITQQPANRGVVEGESTSFTVLASGSSPLSYRWQKNNVNLSNGGHYSGVTTNVLTITGADTNDVASYRCVVTNAYGSTNSSAATLTLVVGCAPGNLVNADFEGSNSGGVADGWTAYEANSPTTKAWTIQTASPPEGLQYQQIQAYNAAFTGSAGVRQNITGCVIGATYTISGWYRSNSDNGRARVRVSPSASTDWNTAQDLNPVADYGSTTNWAAFSGTVVATGTNMTLWLDGRTIGGTSAKVGCFDSVTMTCVAAAVGPGIVQQPSSQSIGTGGTANFTILANGSEPLNYRWQKNSTNLNNGGHYSGVTTTTLTITSTDATDAASYRCVVTNAYGSTNTGSATLTVTNANTPPAIVQQPSAQNVAAGGTTSFTVLASGSEPLSYQWQKSVVSGQWSVVPQGGHYSGATTNTLTITSVDSSDAANYRCVVTNAYGVTNSSAATLTIITPNACLGLLNADFEGGFSLAGGGYIATNWTEWESVTGMVIGYDETTIVHGGSHAQRIRVSSTSAASGGVYQRVPVTAGNAYTVSVWLYADDPLTVCSLGVDPAGGTNASSGVTWSSGSSSAAWVQKTWTGNATANYLTVYYRVSSPDTVKRNGYFDDGTPGASSGAQQLQVAGNGDGVTLSWSECPAAHLERAESLVVPMSWSAVTNQVSTFGGQQTVTLTPSGTAGYFRLVVE